MKWTSLNDLREVFFKFFESKNHLKLDSFSLVPDKKEKSLLLINSGMAPMKDWFLGVSRPQSKRVVTCQKCIRTVDLQNVGKTARHGTFFEMLGNFSFGDYFKQEAISFAWEFVTTVLNMPLKFLYVTVFESDDEAKTIWQKQGVPSDHIVELGKADNFWEIGKGPCGPCSELYFDRGEKFGCGKLSCGPGCDCDRFVEFWNLVFSQFCSDGHGNYENLKQKNIDTGMGLERLACIMQGVDNLFEVDSIKKILLKVCDLAKIVYGQNKDFDVLVRIIVDHLRSSVFLISDGVLVSNEGRGYVLRRLIRRAISSAKALNIKVGFLGQLADVVVQESGSFYLNLSSQLEYIKQVLSFEEQNFEKILRSGKKLFDELVVELNKRQETKISADRAFKLCDTFGMPYDLLVDLATQRGFEIDEQGFSELLENQKKLAREDASRKSKGWRGNKLAVDGLFSEFVGYDVLNCVGKLQAIFLEYELVETAFKGQKVELVFDKTPFYAQAGGQVGDCGVLTKDGKEVAEVLSCKKLENGVFCHEVLVKEQLNLNELYSLEVDEFKRKAVSRNHTCAHILQQVLIEQLGEHVHQAGQLVDFNKLRFDFSHFQALTEEEFLKIEQRVNDIILSGFSVEIKLMNLDEAKALGAKALFDDRYDDRVRVVNIGDFSKELCGGTHILNSLEIGLFKIVSESSVGSGVRRIEAVTGYEALKFTQKMFKGCEEVCRNLNVKFIDEAAVKVDELKNKLKCSESDLSNLKFRFSENIFKKSLIVNYFDKEHFDLAVFDLNILNVKMLKNFAEDLIARNLNLILLICSNFDSKFTFLVGCSKNVVVKGLSAGDVVKTIAGFLNKKGGGRTNLAMAGLSSASDFEVVKSKFMEILKNSLN